MNAFALARVAATLAALLPGLSAPVLAIAVYSSEARSIFTLTPVAPVTAIVDHAPFTSTATLGDATASIDLFAASPAGVHPATIASKVSGSATAPPPGLSSSFAAAQRGHVFDVPRVSAAGPLPTVTMSFVFEISWETHLAITRVGAEFAAGGAFFGISGFEAGIDSIALDPGMPGEIVVFPDGSTGWRFNPNYLEFDGSPVDELHSLRVTGSITVLSGMVGEFSVITDVAGRAISVPEPTGLALLAIAWIALRSVSRSAPGRE